MAAVCVGLLLTAPGARAQDLSIPGAEVPEFRAALASWLADDEGAALAALQGLATGGNTAARLWLALIDKTPSLQGPALARVPRAERIALLRQPGGMSGRSWLHALEDLPLAQAWLNLRHADSGPEAIAAFAALSEDRAARQAFVALAQREHPALATLPPDQVPADLRYLLWPGADAARQDELRAAVPADDLQRGFMDLGPVGQDALADWLARSDAGRPLAVLCATACPDSQRACLTAAYRALGSHPALLTLGSPAEVLVSQQDFVTSPRGQGAIMRRILLSVDARGRRLMLARLNQSQQCLAQALDAENLRYRSPRSSPPPSSN